MTALLLARCAHPCAWHRYAKHVAFVGMTREDTSYGPARYLPGVVIRAIESETVQGHSHTLGALDAGRTEYARHAGRVIGYDEGRDAEWSYVECSGATVAPIGTGARSFHGQPVHSTRAVALGLREVAP